VINKLLKKGSVGPEVAKLQSILKIKSDGIFGAGTQAAVIKFQLSKNLRTDGIVAGETWTALITDNKNIVPDIDEDTDLEQQFFVTDWNQRINKYFLGRGEYIETNAKRDNDYFFLHHTAGGPNPYRTIDQWNRDSRGRIATEFVLGGQNYRTGDDEYDGVMVQAFPETGYAYHLGKTGSGYMNKYSVGLEICSIGYLDNQFNSYVGKKAHPSQVIQLDNGFKRRIYWHKYSDKQIEETEKLIQYVAQRDNIDVKEGLQKFIHKQGKEKAFHFQEDAYYGKVRGLLSHTNVRKDKMDVYPDPRLIDMIMSL